VRLIGAGATDFFCMLFAAIVHDVGHPGLNNVWHVKSNHPVAIRYNDKAVLENMHISIAYSLSYEDENANIFKSMSREKFDAVRASVILLVLATDMTQHFAKLGKLKTRVDACKNAGTPFPEPGKKEDKDLLMENILHACDIANPAQRTSIYLMWTDRVLQEFFEQGDREKGKNLAVSMFMDRDTTNIAKMQIGFISFVVTPLYSALETVIEMAAEPVAWLSLNKDFWGAKVDEMEEQMKTCGGKYTLPPPEDATPEQLKARIDKQREEKTAQA
jgi:hypothetical protein